MRMVAMASYSLFKDTVLMIVALEFISDGTRIRSDLDELVDWVVHVIPPGKR